MTEPPVLLAAEAKARGFWMTHRATIILSLVALLVGIAIGKW